MLIGFTSKTSKILPRIFCRRFRHCAIVIECRVPSPRRRPGSKCRYLFVHKVKTGIHVLNVSARDLKILEKNGWVFVKTNRKLNSDPGLRRGDGTLQSELCTLNSVSCVAMARRALGIRNPFILTPDQLYRYLTK